MIYLVIFLSTILFLIAVVRIGAVALRLTGMEWDNAWFQALSAFSTAGYTTTSAEKVLKDDKRRVIISWLMVLGNAGFATLVITLVKTLDIRFNMNFICQALYLGGIILSLVLLYLILNKRANFQKLMKKADRLIEKYLIDSVKMQKVNWEEILHINDGYGFARVEVQPDCPYCGMKLSVSGLVGHDIVVVAIERITSFIPTPDGEQILQPGDMLTCYGRMDNIRTELVDKAAAPAIHENDSNVDPEK